jgi:hypothetical protein
VHEYHLVPAQQTARLQPGQNFRRPRGGRGCRLSDSEGQGRAARRALQRETGGGGGSTAGQYTQCTYKCGFEKVAPQHLVALLEDRWLLNPASLGIYAKAYSRSEVVYSRPWKAQPVPNYDRFITQRRPRLYSEGLASFLRRRRHRGGKANHTWGSCNHTRDF